MKYKKELRIFTVTFFVVLLSFSFAFFSTIAYINSHNMAYDDKLYLPDIQKVADDVAVISVLDKEIQYNIPEKKQLKTYQYTLIPHEWRLLYAGLSELIDKLLD